MRKHWYRKIVYYCKADVVGDRCKNNIKPKYERVYGRKPKKASKLFRLESAKCRQHTANEFVVISKQIDLIRNKIPKLFESNSNLIFKLRR